MVSRPNILLIMTDQQRYDAPGYYRGNGSSDTPRLDQLAASGVVFDSAYSSDTACIPARSSLMTGLLPHRVPTGGWRPRAQTDSGRALREGYWTLAHALRDAGYRTGLFGKMHFAPIRAQHGFDVMQTCEHLPAGYDPSEQDDYRRWILSTGRKDLRFVQPAQPKVFPYPMDAHPTRWITRHALEFLQGGQQAGSSDGATAPWFAVVSYTDPHTPFSPPEPYASMYLPAEQVIPESTIDSNRGLPWPFSDIMQRRDRGAFFAPQRTDQHSADYVRRVLAAIRAAIRHVDDAMAQILQAVNLDETLVVFLSDHGDYGGHRGFLGKIPWLPFDDLARIPFVIGGAGVAGGRRLSAPVQSFDYVATVLDRVGLARPCGDMDAVSLLPVLAGADADTTRAVFCATMEGTPMLRRGRYKHIWHSIADAHILYDLEEDPEETRNIAAEPRHRDLLAANVEVLREVLARPVPDLWRTGA